MHLEVENNMQNNRKMKKIDIKLFIMPFIMIMIIHFIVATIIIKQRIEESYESAESQAISIAKSYSKILTNSEEAKELFNNMLEINLLLAGESIALYEQRQSNEELTKIANKLRVDALYIYNPEGEIIYTNMQEYLGWKAPDWHPVYNFMVSGEKSLVEDVRPDTESGIYYKYGYYRLDDGTFIQIGILTEKEQAYLERFNIQTTIESIKEDSTIEKVCFIDKDFKIINSTEPEMIGQTISYPYFQERINKEQEFGLRSNLRGTEIYTVYVPVIYEGSKIGTLAIGRSIEETLSYVRSSLLNGTVSFLITSFIIGIVTYIIYKESKKNLILAYYDHLTGLPNQYYMYEYIKESLNNRTDFKKAMFIINCSNFKTINTTYGYNFGDKILKQISKKINYIPIEHSMFFRFNADRFVLFLERYKDINEIEEICKNILSAFDTSSNEYIDNKQISIAIGIAKVDEGHMSVDDLIKDASIALSDVKRTSSSKYSIFDREMKEKLQRKHSIENVIRRILLDKNSEELFLEYQPQIDLKTNKVYGFEALARIDSREMGLIDPAEFIEVAEEKHLIYDLGILISEKACFFAKKIMDMGFHNIKVAINISAMELFRDDFIENITKLINNSGINYQFLEIEITESILLTNFEIINEKLEILRSRNIQVLLDDFGTGYSSFSRLRDLSIDKIKIDKSFIDKIQKNKYNSLITADIISMAHKMGLEVIAEGVETELQKSYLFHHHCDIVQGFLISMPLKEADAIEYLKKLHV